MDHGENSMLCTVIHPQLTGNNTFVSSIGDYRKTLPSSEDLRLLRFLLDTARTCNPYDSLGVGTHRVRG